MSATQSPPVPPRPMMPPSPAAGAVNGMPAQNPQAQMAMKFQTVLAGVKEIIQVLSAAPGVDQAKLQQGVAMLQQAMEIIATAIPKPGGAGAPPTGAPPGGPPR